MAEQGCDLVGGFFDECRGYADSTLDVAQTLLQSLANLAAELEMPKPDPLLMDVDIPDLTLEDRPSLGNIDIPDFPESRVRDPIINEVTINEIEIPEFNETADVSKPTAPNFDAGSPPGDAPSLTTFSYPVAPDPSLPIVPVLESLIIPSPPIITLPSFDATVPVDDTVIPSGFVFTEAAYNSDVWADLLAKVLNDIRNGGTGLDPLVEQELYDRALARQETENERLFQETEDYFSARGFFLPSGAMAGRMSEVGREISRNNTRTNAEIMINQADLAQKNTHFMIEKGITLEGVLRDFYNNQSNRTFEAAKVIAQSAIDIFNAQINKYNARINAYQTQAGVYETRVKAALVQIDIYKGQIEGLKVSSDVQKNQVDIYAKQIDAVQSLVNVYVAQMEGLKARAQVEQLKIEAFKAEIQAYVARQEGNRARAEVYGHQVKASLAEAQIFGEKVRAYQAQLDGTRTKADILVKDADIRMKNNDMNVEVYKAQMSAYQTEVETVASQTSFLVESFKAEAAAYTAETEVSGIKLNAEIKRFDAVISQAKANADISVEVMRSIKEGYIAMAGLQVKCAESSANIAAQLCASAISAINASATCTQSKGVTHRYSESTSLDTNFNYNYSY